MTPTIEELLLNIRRNLNKIRRSSRENAARNLNSLDELNGIGLKWRSFNQKNWERMIDMSLHIDTIVDQLEYELNERKTSQGNS